MGPCLDGLLALIGLWLLIYRGFIRTRCRFWVELLAQISCGAAIVLLVPLFTSLPEAARAALLLTFGIFIGTCHAALSALTVAVSIASFLGALSWQLGLSGLLSGLPHAFTLLLVTINLIFSVLFCATPLGPLVFERFLVPILGAALLSTGAAGLAPGLGALAPDVLFSHEPFAAEGDASPQVNLLMWLVLTIFGVLSQACLLRQRKPSREETEGMKASLLFNPPQDDEEGGLIPRPNDDGSRFQVLVKAIFAEPGADQSHLSEHERKLVKVCQEDEFERDRVLWGGGLI
eukprot:TRINITY_DN30863_c0_g1_i1.p1 TRINITY_DN30863_c0_g1~~TRINITY_DN30863_c0_g1_i1.p1  ORF type:complete len:290 (-),score=60.26 TRINITY_DN30863_c0_g1_i1:68-937(-)